MSLTQEVQAKNQSILQTPDHDRDSYIEDADHRRRNNAQHHNLAHEFLPAMRYNHDNDMTLIVR